VSRTRHFQAGRRTWRQELLGFPGGRPRILQARPTVPWRRFGPKRAPDTRPGQSRARARAPICPRGSVAGASSSRAHDPRQPPSAGLLADQGASPGAHAARTPPPCSVPPSRSAEHPIQRRPAPREWGLPYGEFTLQPRASASPCPSRSRIGKMDMYVLQTTCFADVRSNVARGRLLRCPRVFTSTR